jgi:hypothetical protein
MAEDKGEGKREWKAVPRCSVHQEKLLADLSNAFYELQYPRGSGTEGYGVIPVSFVCWLVWLVGWLVVWLFGCLFVYVFFFFNLFVYLFIYSFIYLFL